MPSRSARLRPLHWAVLLAIVGLLVSSGCGDQTSGASAGIDTVPPALRIVPVDGDLTEIVFALGLGDEVVATDISATYPDEATTLPRIGYQRALGAEPIAAVEPTVVLATDLAGPPETLDALRTLGVRVVVIDRDHSLDGPAKKIQAVADALGVSDRGAELADKVTEEIEANMPDSPDVTVDPVRVAVVYLRGTKTQLILGTDFTIHAVLEGIGAVNVGAELGIAESLPINAEALLRAEPDVLIVTTAGLESVGGLDGLLEIPGIAQTPAGIARRILVYEDQYLLGGGPRTGALVAQLASDLTTQPRGEP
jgi:iron complex transport system substrate-binding protein